MTDTATGSVARRLLTIEQLEPGDVHRGDLLLYRGKGLLSRLISCIGRSPYTHAAMLAYWGAEPMVLEVREFRGGRAVTLASQVARYSGRIDLFRANPDNRWTEFHRRAAMTAMRDLCGCDYGIRAALIAGLSHLPLVRRFVSPSQDDLAASRRPPYCSQAIAMAYRIGGGVDPVLLLTDRLTEPGDLARSPFFKYSFTLIEKK